MIDGWNSVIFVLVVSMPMIYLTTKITKGTKGSDNYFEFRVRRTTKVDNLPGSRKLSSDLQYPKRGLTPAKAQSAPSSEGRDELS